MKDLARDIPKPMLVVQGKPILETILVRIRDATTITDFFLVTGHQAHVVEAYFGDGSRWGVSITYGRQSIPNGTAKALEVARQWVNDDPFLLSYGDILVDPTAYSELLEAYEPEGVIACVRNQDFSQGGAVFLDPQGKVLEILEKPAGQIAQGAYYNAGIYALSPAVFSLTERVGLSPRGEYELTDALRVLASSGKLKGVPLTCSWVDVRDPETLSRLTS
ncbi:Nucleotidyl transferase [Candidatus Methylacidithermus pantelleriae]|uniref:Nucleotidyl transferase n=2 Tax=Candidatus Methylacidithermus pantelleriae TaxID=2744239 RepID=A0A8J2BS97_9BACT|nr:Nucleotidyl transferase [Candidatus Methylacidithermus pantelleriae]